MRELLKEFYIDNVTNNDQVITLAKKTSCATSGYEDVQDFAQTAPANTETKINFPSDGVYEVFVDTILEGVANYQLGLFKGMIVYVSAALCNDSSTNCLSVTQCTTEVLNFQNTAITKEIQYSSNLNPLYNDAVIAALEKIYCSSIQAQYAIGLQEKYVGLSNTESITKIEIAHLYLELYKTDVSNTLPIDIEELNTMYDYTKISYCIQQLGILDCEPAPPTPGTSHTSTLSVAPITIGLGSLNSITLTYQFVANDDVFTSIIDTNIPNVTLAKLDGYTHNEPLTSVTAADTYYITYAYTRDGSSQQNTVNVTTIAYAPQWFGGESATDDYAVAGKAYQNTIESSFNNITSVYQADSDTTTSNSNTANKYIWWITKNPVRFFIGAFEIISGPWAETCDPNSYAIIHKSIVTVMADGVTEQTLHYYRTCPLQNLDGRTLTYILKQ